MAQDPGLLLEARGISKSFPGVRALHRVDCDVRRGEVHALLGENGAGKSTLVHILAGVFEPDEGVLRMGGREMRFRDARAAQEAGIAMVFQERSLAGPLSVAENVFFGRQPVRRWSLIDKARLYRQTRVLLDDLGIGLDPATPLESLSPAQQQMVEIAKALSLNACLLVLDEPTSTLTEPETAVLFGIIERLKQRGVGIVYISHRMAEVFRICDRMTVLRDGEHQGTFARQEITEDELISRMVGRRSGFEALARARPVPAGSPALEVRRLRDAESLRDISFVARAGEITAFAGLAGSGRTELAMCVFGARPMTAGEVRIHGQPVKIRSPGDAIAAGVGYLPEDRKEAGLFLEMSVAANVCSVPIRDEHGHSSEDVVRGRTTYEEVVNASRWWVNDRVMERQAATVTARMRLTGDIGGRRVQELSGGNQQKVILARWLLVHPPILIVDEPTRGVDVGAKREVHQLLGELADAGTAVVLISSELPEILAVADRILVMREGRLVGEVPRAAATEESIMRLAAIRKSR
ncbi:MAG: sugar ABC transporter ATP-binding protein [Planctomycetes bacterium]|jgi:ABC-type sugar transport system ATPase subunit|nr:sugar ABC transporter ATP-binding protein [Planctomycetota bacterium]